MVTAAIYFFAALAALATLLMIFQRDPVKAALLMLAALLSTAGIYLALSAQLLAALQVILYAGAIMTLFIVALSVIPLAWKDKPSPARFKFLAGLAVPAVIFAELLKVAAVLRNTAVSTEFSETGAYEIARRLFGPLAFQLELIALVILASIAGAVAIAMKRRTAQ